MQTEEQFARELSYRMREETHAVRAEPGLAGVVQRRHRRRRFAIRSAVAAVAVVAASVTGAVLVHRPSAPAFTANPPTGTPNPPVIDAAFVSARLAALGPATDYVVKVHSVKPGNTPDATDDTWIDRTTGDLRSDSFAADGSRLFSAGQTGDRRTTGITVLWVDFPSRTWFSYTRDPDPALSPGVQQPEGVALGAYSDPQNVRDAIDKGYLSVIGQEQVDGVATTHARLSFDSPKVVSVDLWLDNTTFLPIKMIDGVRGNLDTMTLQWLPRTPPNLAELTVTPPAGFTRTPAPPVPNKIPLG
jgi:hypothetical protein